MRVGTSIRSFYPDGDPRAIARSMIERTAAARRAGLDSLFVGDHHATTEPYMQNVPMLGRLLAEWGDAPFGALFLLPLWNPLLAAEQIGTLAAIGAGPFVAQLCVGRDPDQFRAMGSDPRTRGATFERHFEILSRLLAGEAVDGHRIAPVPVEPVTFWIGASAPVAVERAARRADAWLVDPGLPAAPAGEQLRDYLALCERLGRPPRATPIRRNLHVAADERELERYVRPALSRAGPGVTSEATIVGTIDQVTEAFRSLETAGFDQVIARHFVEEPAAVIESIERLGEVRRRLI